MQYSSPKSTSLCKYLFTFLYSLLFNFIVNAYILSNLRGSLGTKQYRRSKVF